MLRDPEMFDVVENILTENGTIDNFEKENGKIKGRMMITLTEIPEELGIQGGEGIHAFDCSFDFYEASIGLAINTATRELAGGLWVTPQVEGADAPDETWVEFFIKTLVENIDEDGSFGVPMYTFTTDEADFTVVPSPPEDN